MPAPSRLDNRPQIRIAWFPPKFLGDLFRRGNQGCGVTCPTAADLDRDRVAGDFQADFDHFLDGVASAVAQVVDHAVTAVQQGAQRQGVGRGQVADMDIIADAGAVRCGVVVTVDGDEFPLAKGNLEDDGDEMGFRVGGLRRLLRLDVLRRR